MVCREEREELFKEQMLCSMYALLCLCALGPDTRSINSKALS